MQGYRMTCLKDYEQFVGTETVERIRRKAKQLQGLHVVNVNSTYYGGGVSPILSSLTLLMNGLGIKTGWRVVHGPPDFFSITKKIHNALQGGKINLSDRKCKSMSKSSMRMPFATTWTMMWLLYMIRSHFPLSITIGRTVHGSGAATSTCLDRIRNSGTIWSNS